MKKILILAAAAAMFCLASCQKNEIAVNEATKLPVFTASINSGTTKTTLDATTGKLAWESSDVITVTDFNCIEAEYKIESIDEETGKATFVVKSAGEGFGTAPYVACYGDVAASIQVYTETPGDLLMYAPSTDGHEFVFTVQGGLIRLNLTKAGTNVQTVSVTNTANNTYSVYSFIPQSIDSAKDFFIAVPAGIYKKVEITDENGNTATLLASSGIDVKTNRIVPVTLGEDKIVFLDEDALLGKFTVNKEGKAVHFSKGNLLYDGSWKFEDKQYSFHGYDAESNTWGLFGWSTSSSNYGRLTSQDPGSYAGGFVDWGKNIGDGKTWRTLSEDEWTYLFHNHNYKWITVCGTAGMAVAPDNVSCDEIESTYATDALWKAAENDGFIFLPAAGVRNGASVNDANKWGYYWSSDMIGNNEWAQDVYFSNSSAKTDHSDSRYYGECVRLVTEGK